MDKDKPGVTINTPKAADAPKPAPKPIATAATKPVVPAKAKSPSKDVIETLKGGRYRSIGGGKYELIEQTGE